MVSLLAFFILICILVFVHEYGHFWAARRCGVRVLRFSIGFGKVLFRKTDKQGTEFAFSLIPLGGYVQMYNGEENEPQYPRNQALSQKSVGQRIFIVLAGPVANFLFAIIAYWAVFMAGVPTVKPVVGAVLPNSIAASAELLPEFEIKEVDNTAVRDWEEVTLALVAKIGASHVEIKGSLMGEDRLQTRVVNLAQWQIESNQNPLTALGISPKSGEVLPEIKTILAGSAAEKANLAAGDRIISVNHQPFNWHDLVNEVQTGKPLHLEIEHLGEKREVQLQPEKSAEGRFLVGITPTYQPLASQYRTEIKYDILEAFWKSTEKVAGLIKTICQFIGNLITGNLSLSNLGGPISIAKGAGSTAEIGLVYYLSFMALISVNLGVMNLFPILPLDGGRLLLLMGEGVFRKPLPMWVELRFQQLGMVLVLGLMVFALFNDLTRF